MDSGLWPHKLKTPIKTRFASKVIMFEETLKFKATILLCYGKQKTLVYSNVPKDQVWTIVEVVTTCLNFVVSPYVLNQSKGYYLMFDALVTTINLILAMEFQPNPFANGGETCDQFDVELQMWNKNMQ
jgi:hypothetical protein